MDIEASPKVVSFRTNMAINTQTSDLISSNQRQIESAKDSTPVEKNRKIQQYMDGIQSENTERNNYDSTNNTSSLSNLSPLKQKLQLKEKDQRQFTFVTSEDQQQSQTSNSSFFKSSNLKNKVNHSSGNLSSSQHQPQHQRSYRKSSCSSSNIKIAEEKYCKFCNQPDNYQNFIRPCLCKGSMQHVHQQCVQENIEKKYMDEEKRKFVKPLLCESCQFKFIIKSYKKFHLFNSLKDPIKHGRLIWFLLILITLITTIFTLIIVAILKSEEFSEHIDYIVGVVIACLILIGIMILVTHNILELISNNNWYILDREQARIEDEGEIMNQESLNLLIEVARKKQYSIQQKIIPKQELL